MRRKNLPERRKRCSFLVRPYGYNTKGKATITSGTRKDLEMDECAGSSVNGG